MEVPCTVSQFLPAAPDDYTSVTRLLNFTNTVTEHIINVPIINDDLVELTETFLSNLRLVSKVGVEVIIEPGEAVVNIHNDDG